MATCSARRHFHDVHGADPTFEGKPLLFQETLTAHNTLDVEIRQTRAALTTLALTSFDGDDEGHRAALLSLWSHAFPGKPFARQSHLWSEHLGFQGRDPATDLRGSGYLSLLHLERFLATTGSSFIAEADGFPLALASFSCSAMLCKYLGLNQSLIFPDSNLYRAAPRLVESFDLLNAQTHGHDLLQVMHSRLLRHLASRWSAMRGPSTTIMDFPVALRSTYRHLHCSLSAIPQPWSLSTVTDMLERDEVIDDWQSFCGAPGICTMPFLFFWVLAARLACGALPMPEEHRRR